MSLKSDLWVAVLLIINCLCMNADAQHHLVSDAAALSDALNRKRTVDGLLKNLTPGIPSPGVCHPPQGLRPQSGPAPHKLALSDTEMLDLRQCPKPLTPSGVGHSENDFVTIGDLHGSAGKLVFFLVKEGIASFHPEANCQKLLNFYYQNPKATQFPLDSELIALIHSIVIKKPPEVPNVRLIGDEFADRGKNDGITIKLLEKLDSAQPAHEIMMSNHSIEFLRAMSGLPKELSSNFITSSLPIKALKSKTPKSDAEKAALQEVQDFMSRTYLKHLKLVSVTPQAGAGPVVFTHAPTEPEIVFRAAYALGVATGNCESASKLEANINECADRINGRYLMRVREALAIREDQAIEDDPRNILNHNMSTDAGEGTPYDPIAEVFWKRHSPKWDASRKNGSWQTANGHDRGVGSTFELDNILGKAEGYDSGFYQVLRPESSHGH